MGNDVEGFAGIEEFATTARTLGTSLNSAAAATAAGAALSAATFGIIGADFAAAFTNAQLQFCGAIGQLGSLFDSVGAAAQASAASYADGDGSAATRITGAGL